MSPIDYDAVRSGGSGLPPDGIHDAYLDAARLVDTRSGEALVIDWRTVTDPLYQWPTFHYFAGQRLGFTLELLDALGVDRSTLSDAHPIDDAMQAYVGLVYAVKTTQWGSGAGANVEVLGESKPQAAAQQSMSDLPHDPVEVDPDPVEVGASSDDDIPF